MGTVFPVYPPEDLNNLDLAKRKELAMAIRQVLHTDPEVRELIKRKTAGKFEELKGRK